VRVLLWFAVLVLWQTLALTFNLGIVNPLGSSIGGLFYDCGGSTDLSGKTVAQVLNMVNMALGTGVLPSGIETYSDLNEVVTSLNESYDDCKLTTSASLLTASCPSTSA
jgi:hypothetical protein